VIRPILRWPDPRLRAPAAPVGEVTDAVRAIWEDMLDTMRAMPGVGLAAPQIGVPLRLAVVEAEGETTRLSDPAILHASGRLAVREEASPCLPGVSAEVARPRAVTVAYTDEHGARVEGEFVGLRATSVQHQIDHLDGRLYIHRLSKLKRDMLLRKARKCA
jgi:peptide deformylase